MKHFLFSVAIFSSCAPLTPNAPHAANVVEEEVATLAVDTSSLSKKIFGMMRYFQSEQDNYLIMAIEAQDYEYHTSMTYLFDEGYRSKFFFEEWNIENGQGKRYCFLEGDSLVGIWEEEFSGEGGSNLIMAYQNELAVNYYEDAETNTMEESVLGEDFLAHKQEELKEYLHRLLMGIDEGTLEMDEGEVEVKLERDYDSEAGNIHSVQKYRMPEKLYHHLSSKY